MQMQTSQFPTIIQLSSVTVTILERCQQHPGTWPSAEIFPWGSNVDILLIFLQVTDDAVQMGDHKMLYPFYTAKKIPLESPRSIHILFEIVFRWSYIQFAKRFYFPVILCSFC